MIDPRLALAAFGLLILVLALILWPRHGLVSRFSRWSRASRRVSMEDALKHLYNAERRGVPASVESLAGALETGRHHATGIVEDLRDAELVRATQPFDLTEGGRAYALRIIRTHRLWERYLADRTGVAPGEWHTEAEAQEHRLSPGDVEALSARLGHPRFDPHGDPIPTASGEIPAPAGIPLTELAPGDEGLITHLEDEPERLFDRLVDLGLSPGQRVRVIDRLGGRVRLIADGVEVELDPVTGANVTVLTEAPGATTPSKPALTLAELRPGESGQVLGLAPACKGTQRHRLLDLGVVPGTIVRAEFASASNDPVAFDVRGALIALRREQQRWIRIRRADGGEAA
jgi:DtxR family transcriptional regulator, Mn-dependent transcriptional regulator